MGNDTLFCLGDSVKLTASGGQKYLWSTSATAASIYAKKSGTLWARAENVPGCYTYDTIVVSTRALPTLYLGKDTLLCKGDTVILSAKTTGSKQYQWSNLKTDSAISVTTAGLYWARIKDTMCYSIRDTIDVAFQTKAAFSLGKDTSFCVGNSFLLNAALSGAKTWEWKDKSTGSTFLAKSAGTEWVKVSNGTCVVRDTINLTTYSIPPFSLGNDTTLCEGQIVDPIKSVFIGMEYTWMGTVKNSSYPIKTTGKYFVDLRDIPKKVCKSSDTIVVTFKKPLKINLGRDTMLCVGQTVDMTVANYALKSFQWWDNDVTLKTKKNGVPPGGIHWVKADDGICPTSDSIVIKYRPELFIRELEADSVFCDNYSKLLDIAEINSTKYQWKTPAGVLLATTHQYTVNKPGGTFIGIISDGYCYKRDSVTYSYKTTPVVSLGSDVDVCDPVLSATLDATSANAEKYLWNTGASTSSISVTTQGTYSVMASNGLCAAGGTVMVNFSKAPDLDFGFADSIFCDPPNLNYDFSQVNTTFKWQDGSTQPNRKIKLPGVYWLVAQNNCGYDSVSLLISVDESGCRLHFPDAFSPNGDGVNDLWRPYGQVREWVEMVVYDRWGQIIFKGKPDLGWDGSFEDTMVPDGVYPVIVSYRKDVGGYPRLFFKNMIVTIIK